VDKIVPVDLKDAECNIVGCKGLGEPAHVPTAAAIASGTSFSVYFIQLS
jgi:hypothetical protein